MPAPSKRRLVQSFRYFVWSLVLSVATPAAAQQLQVHVGNAPNEDVIALAPQGLDKALEALPGIVTDTLKRSGVPGAAVAVVHGGKTVYSQGFGVRKVGRPEPVDAQTVFQIASLSKPLTASITAVQISKGGLKWDDPVVRHLPDFELGDAYVTAHATIGDFMAHRTGLPLAAGDDLEDLGFERDEIVRRLRLLPLDPFRSSYHYANFGTTTGAEAVAAAAGKQWEDLAQEALFQPLDMASTSARHTDYLARPNRAVLHTLEDGTFQPLFDRDPDQQSPAGGVSSNVVDLAEWLKFLLAEGAHQGQSLAAPRALLDAMSPHAVSAPPHTPSARAGHYGFGFNVGTNPNGRTAFSHSGAFILGAATAFQIVPSVDVGIVVLTNGGPVGAPESMIANFMDIVQFGEPVRDWYAAYNAAMSAYYDPVGDLAGKSGPPNPQPPASLEAYVGSYENDYFGPAQISVDQGQLVLALGPRNDRMTMDHWDEDTFAVTPRSENAPAHSQSSVQFALQADKAIAFTVEYLDGNGLGTWKR